MIKRLFKFITPIREIDMQTCARWGFAPFMIVHSKKTVLTTFFGLHIILYLLVEAYWMLFDLPLRTTRNKDVK